MSTPTTVSANAGVAGKGRLKRKADEVEEISPTPQLKAQGQSFKVTNAGKFKRIKLAARNLLTNLSTKRISVTNISFVQGGLRDGGTFADIAIAMFARTTRHGQEGRLAVKKIRFVIDGDMTEEKIFKLNILVNSSHRAVITDFGSARVIEEAQDLRATVPFNPAASANHAAEEEAERPDLKVTVSNTAFTLTGPAWSLRWAAPEVVQGILPDLASDVWALGWIAWEAITDRYPFEEFTSEPQVTMKLIEGYLPSIYKQDQLSQIHMLCGPMQNCWKLDPKERPPATECWQTIHRIPNAIPVVKRGEQSSIRSAGLLLEIGEIHRLQNRRKEASEAFERGLTIARATGDRATVADLLIRLAANCEAQSKGEQAEAHYTEALAIYRSIGSQLSQGNALRGLGHVQIARSKYIEAESSYAEALAICKTIGDDLGRGNALQGLAYVQRARSKYIEAGSSFAESLAIFKSIGHDHGRVKSALGLAVVRLHQARYAEAKALVEDAAPLAERLQYPWGIHESKVLLQDILEGERSGIGQSTTTPTDFTTRSGQHPTCPASALPLTVGPFR
ncbi:hypothetical protein FS837_012322 [Tulasnella sp. UAMH 9824]|nr:hypothetical protein FS837_012322 [Tulasnella sp. UAMH 9824]